MFLFEPFFEPAFCNSPLTFDFAGRKLPGVDDAEQSWLRNFEYARNFSEGQIFDRRIYIFQTTAFLGRPPPYVSEVTAAMDSGDSRCGKK